MYEALLSATALICLVGIVAGSRYYRDTFHPLVYLGALLGTLYVATPVYLLWEGDLWSFLSEQSLVETQAICLAGVASLLLGAWRGAGPPVDSHKGVEVIAAQERRLRIGAFILGLVAVGSYLYGIANVGGIQAAYGVGYGGGWSESGHVRELLLLSLPALLWMMIGYQTTRPGWFAWGLVLLIASPLITQGLLGARRGPTFMAVVGLAVGWYFMRRRRPHLTTVLGGGGALGVVMLLLATNRDQIYLGSDFNLERTPFSYFRARYSNEYIYGGAVIQNARDRNEFYWGGRYFQLFLVRPIPRSLWPTKYEETSQMLGVPRVDQGNAGLDVRDLRSTVGWVGAYGAAPGIIADVWVEFWWFGMAQLFGIGWMYGRAWRKSRTQGGAWIPCFGILTALSVYLVMQDFEAMGFRALFMLAGSTAVWYGSKFSGVSGQAGS